MDYKISRKSVLLFTVLLTTRSLGLQGVHESEGEHMDS